MQNAARTSAGDRQAFRPKSLSPMIGFTSRTPVTEESVLSESILNSYILPRFSRVDHSGPSGKSCNTANDSRPTIAQRLAALEKLHKADIQRIDQLESQIKELLEQLTTMKELNKTLLKEKGSEGGEVHALYQDLFITDMKQQMNDMNTDMSKFRSQKEQIRKELENVKKENRQLLATVKRYRALLANTLKSNVNKPSETAGDTSSVYSAIISESERGGFGKVAESTMRRLSAEQGLRSIGGSLSSKKIEKLNLVIIQLINSLNFMQVCKVLTRSAKALTKSNKVSIFVMTNKARDQYVKTFVGPADCIGRVRFGNSFIVIHTHKDAYDSEPLFKKLEDLKYPIRHTDLLIIPVVYDREVNLVVQCQAKTDSKGRPKIYNPSDELLLKLISNAATMKIQSIFSSEQEQIEFNYSSQLFHMATKIISSLSHRELANRIRSVLPPIFGFENAGIVFLDTKVNQFFVMIHDPSSDDYFGHGVLRFPFGIGLTAQAISRDGVSVFVDPKSLNFYNPEIDNVGWVHETRSIMMGCLKDWSGNLVGVIQFTNKKESDVNPRDIKRLEVMLGMLGVCVAATNLAIQHFELTVQFKDIMENVGKLVEDSYKNNSDAELHSVFNQMSILKNSFVEWGRNRRHRLL